jgi:carbonic anhydrase
MVRKRIALATLVVLLLSNITQPCFARSWRDLHRDDTDTFETIDTSRLIYLQQQELFYKSLVDKSAVLLMTPPSSRTSAESSPVSIAPSPSPSVYPTTTPTKIPTITPSKSPTIHPSWYPTSSPTIDPYKDNDPPQNPNPWYFNYEDTATLKRGKVALVQNVNGLFEATIQQDPWGQVSRPTNDYWNEFTDTGFGTWRSVLQVHDLSTNQCAIGQAQSPIDVLDNGATCHERHQIRSRPGNTQGTNIQKKIESNKLRLVYERRHCSNITLSACQHPDPPHADFPYGWGGFADVLHIDIKVKSEHTLSNERFDAEMQIYHLHPARRRLAAISVLIRATLDGHNYYFDEAIKAFRIEYNKNLATCQRRLKRQKKLTRDNVRSLINDEHVPIPNFVEWAKNNTAPNMQKSAKFNSDVWNPYHELLIPTIYFYRYDGSITEPPCTEFVSWWISDTPMIISLDQLEQLKIILFTNVDQNCKRTGVQHRRSVARPIQSGNNRPVWKCTSAEFGPDA